MRIPVSHSFTGEEPLDSQYPAGVVSGEDLLLSEPKLLGMVFLYMGALSKVPHVIKHSGRLHV